MKRRSFFYPVLAIIALTGTACNDTSEGFATSGPETSSQRTSSTSGSSRPDNASVDPCSLLDATSDLSEVGTFEGPTRKDRAGARSCVWQLERDNPAGEGLVIALDVRDDQTVDSLTDVGGGVQPGAINDRTAAEAPDPASNDCTLAIALTESSRIDVGIAAMDDVNAACEVAREVAYLVEPRLPKA
jgi:hypothetical protein